MASRMSSFRFKSLSKTIDSQPKQSISQMGLNESFKLPAINSVFKGIKYNDVSLMSGRETKKLRKEHELSGDLEFESAHENLKSMRKKFDTTKTIRLQKQAKMNLLKAEVEKYRTIQDELLHKQNGGKTDTSILHSLLLSKKTQFQQADIQKKVILNLVTNHQKDKVIYAQRIYDLEKQLTYIKKQLQIFDKQGKSFFEGEDRAKKVANKFFDQLKEEAGQRQEHIRSLEYQIGNRKKFNQANSARVVQMQEIAQEAMQDKDQNQKKWYKLLLAQTLLATMLRDKMYREMEKFNVVQTAFKNIKIATGIVDSNVLIYKFLNKQHVYGQLLGKIAQNQGKIYNLKLEAENLYKEHKLLQQEEKELIQIRKKETVNIQKQIKDLEAVEQRKTNTDLLNGKIRFWLSRNMKKFKIFGQEISQIKPSITLSQLKLQLQKYLQILDKNLSQITNKMNPQDQLPVFQIQALEGKINRIKVGKTRKNSVGEQISNHFQQEDKAFLNQQVDALQQDRTQIMKANEKFLKQIYQKNLEIKKARIQAMPKEKKKQPQKKKIVEED